MTLEVFWENRSVEKAGMSVEYDNQTAKLLKRSKGLDLCEEFAIIYML